MLTLEATIEGFFFKTDLFKIEGFEPLLSVRLMSAEVSRSYFEVRSLMTNWPRIRFLRSSPAKSDGYINELDMLSPRLDAGFRRGSMVYLLVSVFRSELRGIKDGLSGSSSDS